MGRSRLEALDKVRWDRRRSQGLIKLEGSPGARSCRYLEGQEKHFGSYLHGNGKHCRYSRREVLWSDLDFIKTLDRRWVEKQGWLWELS